jgi:hypothetical protein
VDQVADAAWRAKAAPFDGVTLLAERLATPGLLTAAARVVELLEERFRETELQTAEDWLEHDAWVNDAESTDWNTLRATVATPEALIEASPSDTYVHRAWLGRGAFYVRWCYYDESASPFAGDPRAGGALDVMADAECIGEAVRVFVTLGVEPTTQDAHQFFADRWNG